tara:strand:+ start:179 stop:676 length:498 start_codon:yes stop_codon:yes gene_type:complete
MATPGSPPSRSLDCDVGRYLAFAFRHGKVEGSDKHARLEAFRKKVVRDSETVEADWDRPGAEDTAGLTLLQMCLNDLPPRPVTVQDMRIFMTALAAAEWNTKKKERDIQYFGNKMRRYDAAEEKVFQTERERVRFVRELQSELVAQYNRTHKREPTPRRRSRRSL